MAKRKINQSEENKQFPLPEYKKEDDIYNKEKEERMDDEDPGKEKPVKKMKGPGSDLDIPGAEMDDADEAIGEEDEENNYYSLGGDDHDDLEEDNE
jgi:hypothetical protein